MNSIKSKKLFKETNNGHVEKIGVYFPQKNRCNEAENRGSTRRRQTSTERRGRGHPGFDVENDGCPVARGFQENAIQLDILLDILT